MIKRIARKLRSGAAVPIALAVALICWAAEADARDIKLLALGDSLTAGYGLAKSDGFTEQLEKALRAEGRSVRVINAGVSGDTTAGGRARLDWALADKPDAVLLELGANDGLRGIEPRVTRENLAAILDRFEAMGLPVLFAGMRAPPNLGPEYGREYDAVFTDLASRRDVVFYPFFLEGVAGKPDLNQRDGIHPTAEGVAVLVGRILPAVRDLLARVTR
jgi:acyl-CoA thioesterase-1